MEELSLMPGELEVLLGQGPPPGPRPAQQEDVLTQQVLLQHPFQVLQGLFRNSVREVISGHKLWILRH